MIAIFTDPAVGGTFLEWSIHYLSGHSHYYSIHKKTLLPVTNTPLTNLNAHNFSSNIISTAGAADRLIPELLDQSASIQTIYFHYFSESAPYIQQLLPNISKSLIVTMCPEQALYRCQFKTRFGSDLTTSLTNSDIMLTNDQDRLDDFVNFFFNQSKIEWGTSKLTNVWDTREFLALNFRPFDTLRIAEKISLDCNHYHINVMELWDRLDESIYDLFRYLDLEICENNLDNWTKTYRQWKKIHKDKIFFMWYFNIIIDYVIKGYNLDLQRFNLDICQEAAIQHTLIYKHNLNLKTWQLEKFTNTQQLHQLLEPNIHPLSQY